MCDTKPSTLLQYVNDLLLCSPSQQDSEMGTANLLNFLASKDTRSPQPRPNSAYRLLLSWVSVSHPPQKHLPWTGFKF
jgi:hypothetical protein